MELDKKFKTFDEQIELLKSKGLIIDDNNKLKGYLKSYNYQNLINGYNDYFMINNDRKENKYKTKANSNGIIELFNFDRQISKYILSAIQNFERKISTSIAYTIAERMKSNGDDSGKIFEYNFDHLLVKKYFNNVGKERWNELITRLKSTIDINQRIFAKYNKFEEIPIWSLVLHISFGDLIFFLENLKENAFFEILKNSCLHNWRQLTKGEIITVFKIIKDIRNRICHNNVLYNISISSYDKTSALKKILKTNKNKNSKIKLHELAQVIEFLDLEKEKFLNKFIFGKINDFKYIDESIKNEIMKNLGY